MPVPLVTRILIADDFALIREGLRKVLDAKPDLEVVAEAADGAEAVD
jgi:DNA-binding NarL/FixJ family response regulator